MRPGQFQSNAVVQRRERKTVKTSALLRVLGQAYFRQRLLDEDHYRSPTEIAGFGGLCLAQARCVGWRNFANWPSPD